MANDFRGVAPTGSPTAGAAIVDGQGHVRYVSPQEASDYRNKGFLNRVGQVGPWASMGLMGYGALTGGTGSLAALGGGAPAASGTTATTGGTVGASTAKSILSGLGKGADVLSTLGPVVSGAAKGSANQRMAEGNQALDFAALQAQQARDQYSSDLSGANAQFGAGMQGAQFASGQQDRERKAAALQSLLGGMQDFKATPGNPAIAAAMGTSTGGARPSALTGNKDLLMQLLSQAGPQAPTYQAPTPYKAPPMTPLPTAGFGENALGALGLGGSILGALGGLSKPKSPGGDMAGTVYNGVPEMPWTLPQDAQDPYGNNALGAGDFYNPNKLQARF